MATKQETAYNLEKNILDAVRLHQGRQSRQVQFGRMSTDEEILVDKKYNTKLTATQERQFQHWATENKIRKGDRRLDSDYDMRGFWLGVMREDPRAISGPDPTDEGRIHFTDTWKKPTHKTFSNESIYATQENYGGIWQGDKYIPQKQYESFREPQSFIFPKKGDYNEQTQPIVQVPETNKFNLKAIVPPRMEKGGFSIDQVINDAMQKVNQNKKLKLQLNLQNLMSPLKGRGGGFNINAGPIFGQRNGQRNIGAGINFRRPF